MCVNRVCPGYPMTRRARRLNRDYFSENFPRRCHFSAINNHYMNACVLTL